MTACPWSPTYEARGLAGVNAWVLAALHERRIAQRFHRDVGESGLHVAEELSGAAEGEIFFRALETVLGLKDRFEARVRGGGLRVGHQKTI